MLRRLEHGLAALGDRADQPLAQGVGFGPQHLFEKFGAGGRSFDGGFARHRPQGREETLDGDAAQLLIQPALVNARAQRPGAEHGGGDSK